jgi:hypothetical protein
MLGDRGELLKLLKLGKLALVETPFSKRLEFCKVPKDLGSSSSGFPLTMFSNPLRNPFPPESPRSWITVPVGFKGEALFGTHFNEISP